MNAKTCVLRNKTKGNHDDGGNAGQRESRGGVTNSQARPLLGGDASPGRVFRPCHQGAWFLCLSTECLAATSSACMYSKAICPWFSEQPSEKRGGAGAV